MDQNQYESYQNYTQTPPVKNAAYYRARAREVLKPCYWYALLAGLIASLLGGLTTGGISFNFNTDVEVNADTNATYYVQEMIDFYTEGGVSAVFDAYPFMLILGIVFVAAIVFSILFSLFVSAPVTLGYQRYNLNVIDGDGKGLSVLFRYFKQGYGKSIGLRVLRGLINTACSLPLLIATFGMLWVTRHAFLNLMTDKATSSDALAVLLMLLVILLASVVTVVLQIWVQYRYAFCSMILAEYPEMRVIDALRNSASLMRGNKWRLFCLEFSFIGWILLTICTCGIGMIFLTPYMQASFAAFYDDITNRAAARETEFPSLNPDDYDPNGQW